MKTVVRVLAVILVLVSIVSVIGCSSGSDKGSFISMVKMLPEDLGGLTFIDVQTLQTDDSLVSTWNLIQQQLIGSDIYGENASKITGLGLAGSDNNVMLYQGDFDFDQMTSMIEQDSVESFEYEGITVWTDQYASSTAVINNVVFVGSSEDIQLCIDVNKGEGTSLYNNKDARDIIGRLPGGYVLAVMIVVDENSAGATYDMLAAGMAESKNAGNISEISLYKLKDSDAAQEFIAMLESQIPSDYDITQDGEYVTIARTSEQPDPNKQAYDSAYNSLQNAAMAYATEHEGVFPTINGTVNISSYDYQLVDICPLLTSEGGILNEMPEGVTSINGSDNDNCDAGCEGCLDTNHYLWAIDEYGYVFSTCVGSNCSEYNADGYQGVWP